MAKKDFRNVNTGRVYDAIAEATAAPDQQQTQEAQQEQQTQQGRKTYTEEQAQEMREAGTTQGRKGCKAVRINMAFPPEMHDFIRTMARVRGESITDFTNHVFAQYMKDNADLYERAKAFLKEF